MATIKNSLPGILCAHIDDRLKHCITILTDSIIPREVNDAMTAVFKAVADQLEKENLDISGRMSINCIFSESDSFTYIMSEDSLASCIMVAFYPLNKLVPLVGSNLLFTVLCEELCHLIWNIRDETLINYKVLEVLKNINEDLTLESLGYKV